MVMCHDHPPLLHLRSDPRSIRWSDPPNIRALKPVRYLCASDPQSRSGSRQSFCVKGGSERNRDGSVLMTGLGFGSISVCSLELSLLNVRRSEGLKVMVKSLATFGEIGDGVESPSCMTAVGGEEVYRGRCMGEG